MEVKAKAKHIRISPRKVRLVVDVVRGMNVGNALNQLKFTNKKAAKPTQKLLSSAIASAVNDFELTESNLFIKEIRVDEGATMKRWMPRARGRATPIRKRTSHISIVLGEIVDSGKKEAKKKEIEKPVKLGEQPKKDEKIETQKDKGVKESKKTEEAEDKKEKGKKIVDPRGEGHGKHAKIEGKSTKGFANKIFRRKSG